MTAQSYATLTRAAGYRTGFVGKLGGVEPGVIDTMFDTFIPLDRSPYLKDPKINLNR